MTAPGGTAPEVYRLGRGLNMHDWLLEILMSRDLPGTVKLVGIAVGFPQPAGADRLKVERDQLPRLTGLPLGVTSWALDTLIRCGWLNEAMPPRRAAAG